MATLEEIYRQAIADDGTKAALAEAAKTAEGLQAFLSERGCDASPEEVAAFLKGKATSGAEGELADEELDAVAGGCNGSEAGLSIVTFGFGCAVLAIPSCPAVISTQRGHPRRTERNQDMATLEEIYQQAIADDGTKVALAEAAKTPEGLQAFLSERGCDAALEEVAEFLKGKAGAEGELADEELDDVAGGGCTVVPMVSQPLISPDCGYLPIEIPTDLQ